MKSFFTSLFALFLTFEAHAAVYTVKFTDANGKEPTRQNYSQDCQLVNADDNIAIPNNNIQLTVGDQLVIKTPRTHSYLDTYKYVINWGSIADVENLKAIRETDPNAENNLFTDLHFDAVSVGSENFDLRFTSNAYQPFVQTPDFVLGHVKVTVVQE